MHLNIKHFVVFITFIALTSCKQNKTSLSRIEGKQIPIDSSYTLNNTVENYILPYRNRINDVLDSTLAYAPRVIAKTDGEYNSSAGNLLADIVFSEANPIFKSRTGKEIDFVLLNHGGIRSIISEGKVSARNAFEIMPFENSIVVAEITGADVNEMISYLIESGLAHPISGIQIVLRKDKNIRFVKIKGKAIDKNRKYYVATSDYLVTGGDKMEFFKNNTAITDTDYLIRNAMIDYFKKVDTIAPVVDDRFYIEK